MIEQLVAVVAGLGALTVFFATVKSRWPENYFAVSRSLDNEISRRPVGYLAFRFLPLAVTCVLVGSVLKRIDEPYFVPLLALGGLHAALTSGRSLVALLRHGGLAAAPLAGAFHVGIFVLSLLTALMASWLVPVVAPYVPTGHELAVALWTALFAGVIGAALLALTSAQHDHLDLDRVFESSRDSIGDELWSLAAATSRECAAEPHLVQAVMLVENIQRPRWLRRAERAAGRVARHGTYGPLQVGANSAGGDDRSNLVQAIHERFRGQIAPRQQVHGWDRPDEQWLRLFLKSYNPDAQWADDVVAAYYWLEHPESKALAETDRRAADGLPVVEVTRFEQRGSILNLAGTASAHEATFLICQRSLGGAFLATEVVTADSGAPDRGTWSAQVQLEVDTWVVQLYGAADGAFDADSETTITLPALPRPPAPTPN